MDVSSTFNGSHSKKANVVLDASHPLMNNKAGRGSVGLNGGMGEVFAGSPNDSKRTAPIHKAGMGTPGSPC